MKHEHFNMKEHGFVGHLAEPDGGSDRVVLVIMVSPTYVPFEGTLADKKTMTGKSIATWKGEDVPYVKEDFSGVKAKKYYKYPAVSHKVLGMWIAYHKAYQDKEAERKAWLHVEQSNARVLLIGMVGFIVILFFKAF